MKTVCKKHGYAYEVSEGCGDCKGIANVRAFLDSDIFFLNEPLKAEVVLIDCKFADSDTLKSAGHGVDEATAKAFRESKVKVDQEYLRQLKAQSFLHMADIVAQFLSDKYEEYGLDGADALNLVEMLDEVVSKIEVKESEILASKKSR